MRECVEKYKAARSAGTLKGMKSEREDFRKAECGPDAAAAPVPTTTTGKRTSPGSAVFPKAVSTKYSNETPGRARMHTCRDQYNANKPANANGGLRWIQKGGGYYSECTKLLKG